MWIKLQSIAFIIFTHFRWIREPVREISYRLEQKLLKVLMLPRWGNQTRGRKSRMQRFLDDEHLAYEFWIAACSISFHDGGFLFTRAAHNNCKTAAALARQLREICSFSKECLISFSSMAAVSAMTYFLCAAQLTFEQICRNRNI